MTSLSTLSLDRLGRESMIAKNRRVPVGWVDEMKHGSKTKFKNKIQAAKKLLGGLKGKFCQTHGLKKKSGCRFCDEADELKNEILSDVRFQVIVFSIRMLGHMFKGHNDPELKKTSNKLIKLSNWSAHHPHENRERYEQVMRVNEAQKFDEVTDVYCVEENIFCYFVTVVTDSYVQHMVETLEDLVSKIIMEYSNTKGDQLSATKLQAQVDQALSTEAVNTGAIESTVDDHIDSSEILAGILENTHISNECS